MVETTFVFKINILFILIPPINYPKFLMQKSFSKRWRFLQIIITWLWFRMCFTIGLPWFIMIKSDLFVCLKRWYLVFVLFSSKSMFFSLWRTRKLFFRVEILQSFIFLLWPKQPFMLFFYKWILIAVLKIGLERCETKNRSLVQH